jgi:LytS/YehU family sensor histidine kinase
VQTAAFGPKHKGFRKLENPLIIPLGERIVGSVAKTGVGEIINDTSKDERYLIDDRIRNSEMTVPIIHNQKVIGVIDSEHSRKGFFKKEDLQLVSTIASLCSNKIIRAKSEMAVKEQEKQLLALDRDLSEAQLTALRAQMNPHFLFNCLNSINWYIIKNRPREASRYLTKFSRLIRLILDHSKSPNIFLSQELEALQLYIELEAMRFDNKFSLHLEIDPTLDLEEIEIAPMILQPFVENAIWHGLMHNQKDENILSIKIYPEVNMLHCIITDNGIGRAEALKLAKSSFETHESKGMKITSERIGMLNKYNDTNEQVLITDLYDEIGRANGTQVHIKLHLS